MLHCFPCRVAVVAGRGMVWRDEHSKALGLLRFAMSLCLGAALGWGDGSGMGTTGGRCRCCLHLFLCKMSLFAQAGEVWVKCTAWTAGLEQDGELCCRASPSA